MDIGIWMIIILLIALTPTLLALILCLILIKKNPYKKLSKNQIYAGFWQRFLAGIIDLIILIVIEVIRTMKLLNLTHKPFYVNVTFK